MAPTENQRSMPRWLPIVVLALVAVRVAMLYVKSASEKRPATSQVQWVPIADAKRIAASTRKPILYEFSADWCKPCKLVERDFILVSPIRAPCTGGRSYVRARHITAVITRLGQTL